jgi:hypothetical protein
MKPVASARPSGSVDPVAETPPRSGERASGGCVDGQTVSLEDIDPRR